MEFVDSTNYSESSEEEDDVSWDNCTLKNNAHVFVLKNILFHVIFFNFMNTFLFYLDFFRQISNS